MWLFFSFFFCTPLARLYLFLHGGSELWAKLWLLTVLQKSLNVHKLCWSSNETDLAGNFHMDKRKKGLLYTSFSLIEFAVIKCVGYLMALMALKKWFKWQVFQWLIVVRMATGYLWIQKQHISTQTCVSPCSSMQVDQTLDLLCKSFLGLQAASTHFWAGASTLCMGCAVNMLNGKIMASRASAGDHYSQAK